MAAFANGVSRILFGNKINPIRAFLQKQNIFSNSYRYTAFFQHLAESKEHNKVNHEVTSNPKEWEYVERLLPPETVPVPTVKDSYSSGWRPMKEEALKHPYFVGRSKNHMLSVYLQCSRRTPNIKKTKICKIHGDIWKLYGDLNAYVEECLGQKVPSYVHEGNQMIFFKGDVVYYIEQFLLSKGF